MLETHQVRKKYFAYVLAFATLLVLVAFTFVKFMVIPYIGFIFNPSDGSIIQVFVTNQSGMNLRSGDRLIKVGTVNFEDFKADRRMALFYKGEAGKIVEIHVLRNGQELTIPWTLPGPNRAEVVDRINSALWLAYAFWLAGIATILIIRPRDTRWLLMVAFYLLTATWLASGSISAGRVWEGAILLRMSIWMSIPVYLHFHWLFPRSLKNLPPAIWWSIYLVATILAGLEWFEVLPESTYFFGFLFALLGSFGLLIFRALSQPGQRGDVRFLAIAAVFAMMPALLLSVTGVLNRYPWFGGLALLGLPILPGAYFYTVYSRQIGGLRVRTNRLIALYVFFVLVGIPSAIGIPLLVSRVESPEFAAFLGVLASLLIAIVSIAVFPPFQRFFEHRILGIPLPPTHLLSAYSSRITTSLSLNSLQHILRDEILPSLLIRQSALVQLNEHDQVSLLYSSGVDSIQVPSGPDFQLLLEQVGNQRVISSVVENQAYRWIRLVLPLNFDGKHIGLWLLGSRDPDDLYPPAEISVLETIANHTAIALVNINQAERLRMLYISNIERQEIERTSLARDLHDEVLNQLASLSMSVAQDAVPEFHKRYNKVASRIRQMVSDLRPAMLTYGLRAAIEELVDGLSDRAGDDVSITMDLPASNVRYDLAIEEHLYRIVQQAAENALKHAQAKNIRISGSLKPAKVNLVVQDNGVGLETSEEISFERLLAAKHYGLAGMYERAAIIGAEMRIDTTPEGGMRLSLTRDYSDEENRVDPA